MAFEMLLISDEDIDSNISLSDVINVVEESFKAYALGKTILPPLNITISCLGVF